MGLNLQNASAVVNLDQPWNPAVFEQRIGRVHRLGQHRPVRVVHLVAQGTIEEGMLSLLGFKSAMFAGVLDGGKDEVFLGGSRLKHFMETVEKATSAISDPMPREPQTGANGNGEQPSGPPKPKAAQPPTATAGDAERASQEEVWTDVVTAGVALLDKLAQAISSGGAAQTGEAGGFKLPGAALTRDEQTGQSYLKLPLPEPETIEKIVDVFAALTGGKR